MTIKGASENKFNGAGYIKQFSKIRQHERPTVYPGA